MGVSLTRGGNVSLTREAGPAGLAAITLGFGWDVPTPTDVDFEVDASALAVNADGEVLTDAHFVFYGNLVSPDGSIEHSGDDLTGATEGDEQRIQVDLASLPAEVDKVVFAISIDEADQRSQSLGQVRNAFIRAVNPADGIELARYDLGDACTGTVVVLGDLYRNGWEWKFRATGEGYASGLAGVAKDYGVNVD